VGMVPEAALKVSGDGVLDPTPLTCLSHPQTLSSSERNTLDKLIDCGRSAAGMIDRAVLESEWWCLCTAM